VTLFESVAELTGDAVDNIDVSEKLGLDPFGRFDLDIND
jgi:hypothetical protein